LNTDNTDAIQHSWPTVTTWDVAVNFVLRHYVDI